MKIEHEYNGKKTGVWAEMICDSAWSDHRISTIVVRIPRIVLAELNTHRALSKNSASSRAIPAQTMRERVENDPYVPWRWPVNGKGMVPTGYVERPDRRAENAQNQWFKGLHHAFYVHKEMENGPGIHKEVTNRLLEPWMWTEVLITATEWQNFLRQRAHPAAQDPIRAAAECVQALLQQHVPTQRGTLHLPYVTDEERRRYNGFALMLASARRCRRVSYLKQGVAVDVLEDAKAGLSGLMEDPPHLSPYEHIAVSALGKCANFDGWMSLRYQFERGIVDVPMLQKAIGGQP